MENIVLYTDGGCSGNPGPGGWAFVIVRSAAGNGNGGATAAARGTAAAGDGAGEAVSSGSGGERVTTNNRMELTAVCRGLSALARIAGTGGKIGVYTDSQYVQKGITQWIASWERNGWMTAGKEPVKNKDLWIELRKLSRSLPLAWHWVKGHAGNRWNEECDRMTQREIARLRR